jgi:hypothetical protein
MGDWITESTDTPVDIPGYVPDATFPPEEDLFGFNRNTYEKKTGNSPYGRTYPKKNKLWNNSRYKLYTPHVNNQLIIGGQKRCFCTDLRTRQQYNTNLVCIQGNCGLCLPKNTCQRCDPSVKCKNT